MRLLVPLVLLASCGSIAPLFCDEETPCRDLERPFCDLTGEFPESEGHGSTCIANPFDAGPTPMTCDPGSVVCEDDTRTECGDDGFVAREEICALGCMTTERCRLIEPSNDHSARIVASELGPNVVLTNGAVINTDTGDVTNGDGSDVSIPFASMAAPTTNNQLGAPLGIFVFRSVEFANVRVEGMAALVVLSYEDVDVRGVIQLSALAAPGPGGSHKNVRGGRRQGGGVFRSSGGAGGSSNNTIEFIGGAGGPVTSDGSVVLARAARGVQSGSPNLIPLIGGDSGGAETDSSSEGGGGGAVQIVSSSAIRFHENGAIVAGGAGGFRDDGLDEGSPGSGGAGGGAGGGVLLEAPEVIFVANSGVAANGGGGGSFIERGADANVLTLTPATGGGGSTPKGAGGAGGAGTTVAQDGESRDQSTGATPAAAAAAGGGGGGSVGRLVINTPTGLFSAPAGAILSPAPAVGTAPTF